VSQFLSVLMLAMAVFLTVCFGVAAWRISDENGVDVTGQITQRSYQCSRPGNRNVSASRASDGQNARASTHGQSGCLCNLGIHRRLRRRDPFGRYPFEFARHLDLRCRCLDCNRSRERLRRLLTLCGSPAWNKAQGHRLKLHEMARRHACRRPGLFGHLRGSAFVSLGSVPD
jgi:hypothetical protein